jgi:hypothetical protein
MSAPTATAPDPKWTWWSGLREAQLSRQPGRPTLFVPFQEHPFPDLDALAAELARRLGGQAPRLTRSVVATTDYDTFPAWSVTGAAGAFVGYAAVQKVTAEDLAAAIVAAARVGSGAHRAQPALGLASSETRGTAAPAKKAAA